MSGLAVLFFLAVSPPAQSQTSKFPDMVRIEADCFTMGSEEFIVEEPEHKVCLNAYYLEVHEVTRKNTVEVEIIKSTFIPAVIKVKKGDTIRWGQYGRAFAHGNERKGTPV